MTLRDAGDDGPRQAPLEAAPGVPVGPVPRRRSGGRRTEDVFGRVRRSLRPSQPAAVTGIFLILAMAALHVARPVFLPVVLALLLDFLLSPVVRGLARLRIPSFAGAAVVLGVLLAGGVWAVTLLAEPAGEWMDRAPHSLRRIEERLGKLRGSVERVSQAAEEVENLTRVGGEEEPAEVQLRSTGVAERWLANTQTLLGMAVVVVVLLYFLLASGGLFLRRLIELVFQLRDEARAIALVREMERQVSRYLTTVTAINLALGVAVGLAMLILGVPNPPLWGALATILNYVPYLGALAGVTILTVVSFLSFDTLGAAVAPPLAYFALTSLEGNFITPTILGRRFALSPVVIFLWLVLWGWMWGIPGALLAVPMLTTLKIVCDHVPALAPVGRFLER